MARHRSFSATRSGTIAIAVGVTALAVVVVALSVVALREGRATDAETTPHPVTTFSFPARSASPTPTPTATAPTDMQSGPAAAERFLSVGADAMWRATAGACGSIAPLIERSADDGATWTNVTPTYQGIAHVRALTSFGGRNATAVVDLGDSCETTTVRTYTDGRFWEPYPDIFATDTYTPASAGEVVIGGRPVTTPCGAPWGLRAVDATVALICDGTAYRLDGDDWSAVVVDARAVAATSDGVLVARVGADCDGILVTDYRGEPADLACVSGVGDEPLALDVTGERVWLWAGAQTIAVAG